MYPQRTHFRANRHYTLPSHLKASVVGSPTLSDSVAELTLQSPINHSQVPGKIVSFRDIVSSTGFPWVL
jgi:hypothetical protein